MNDPTPIAHAPANFVTTRWTLVLRAQGESSEARLALGELCEAYWQPVFRFLRGEGKDEDTARDLTQGFFARLLASGGVANAEAGRTRFRSYLLGALKHFLADERKQSQRLKRGGGVLVESLDAPSAAGSTTFPGLQVEDPLALPPDTLFDWEWALTVMQRALVALQREFDAAAKRQDFEVLKPWLVGTTDALSHREAAAQLKTTEGAVKVAIHRFRKRFREIIRSELVYRFIESGAYYGDPCSASNFRHRCTTGSALISAIPLSMRSRNSSQEATRIPRKNVRAIFPNRVSTKFSHDP